MLDDRFAPQPIAGWFMAAAIASLLFMGLGCVVLALHLTTDPATLPLDQRALLQAEPAWTRVASAIGFAAGAIGALLLIFRRRTAEPAMLLSLLGIVLWLGGMFATPSFRDLLTTDEIAFLLIVGGLSWTIFWFARHSRQRGWLRKSSAGD